jgi:predicted secreted Zn-dependent protease
MFVRGFFRKCFPALTAVLFVLSARAQNSVRWTTNYYTITGATLPELRQSIRQNRPWKERLEHDAMTDWRMNWQFTVTPTPGGCRCSTFGTQTTIAITMPRWAAPTNAPDSVREIWRKYSTALGQHEAGHAAIALAVAAELHKRIKSVGEAAGCDELRGRIDLLGRQVVEEHRQREREYDGKTRHGATQGAALPGRARRER